MASQKKDAGDLDQLITSAVMKSVHTSNPLQKPKKTPVVFSQDGIPKFQVKTKSIAKTMTGNAPTTMTTNEKDLDAIKFSMPSNTQTPAPTARMVTHAIRPLKKHEVAPGLLQAMSKRRTFPRPKMRKPSASSFVKVVPPKKQTAHPLHPKIKSRFWRLPKTLRKKVYSFALVDDDALELLLSPPCVKQPPLLRTCRQIRAEALPIFYGENAFHSRFHYDIYGWLQRLNPEILKLLQCVQLTTPQPAGYVEPSLRELTQRCPDGLDPESVSVPMEVQGEKGWLTWVTLGELNLFEHVGDEWRVDGPIRRKSVLKRKREE